MIFQEILYVCKPCLHAFPFSKHNLQHRHHCLLPWCGFGVWLWGVALGVWLFVRVNVLDWDFFWPHSFWDVALRDGFGASLI